MIGEGEEIAPDVVDAEFAPTDAHEFALAGGDLVGAGDDVTGHGSLYKAFALPLRIWLFCASVMRKRRV